MTRLITVSLHRQCLEAWENGRCHASYPVSTARKGPGEQQGSYRTPRGWHQIRLKIGEGCPIYSVFRARRPTGEIYTPELGLRYPERDWILTRILWLSGLESGFNRGGRCDTLRRYIYIHGTHEEHLLGQPASHGCIRMGNRDVLALFDWVSVGTRVLIEG